MTQYKATTIPMDRQEAIRKIADECSVSTTINHQILELNDLAEICLLLEMYASKRSRTNSITSLMYTTREHMLELLTSGIQEAANRLGLSTSITPSTSVMDRSLRVQMHDAEFGDMVCDGMYVRILPSRGIVPNTRRNATRDSIFSIGIYQDEECGDLHPHIHEDTMDFCWEGKDRSIVSLAISHGMYDTALEELQRTINTYYPMGAYRQPKAGLVCPICGEQGNLSLPVHDHSANYHTDYFCTVHGTKCAYCKRGYPKVEVIEVETEARGKGYYCKDHVFTECVVCGAEHHTHDTIWLGTPHERVAVCQKCVGMCARCGTRLPHPPLLFKHGGTYLVNRSDKSVFCIYCATIATANRVSETVLVGAHECMNDKEIYIQ